MAVYLIIFKTHFAEIFSTRKITGTNNVYACIVQQSFGKNPTSASSKHVVQTFLCTEITPLYLNL